MLYYSVGSCSLQCGSLISFKQVCFSFSVFRFNCASKCIHYFCSMKCIIFDLTTSVATGHLTTSVATDQFQGPGSNSLQGWHFPSRNLHQDCLGNGKNGQIKQDLVKKDDQLYKQVVQVSCHLHSLLWL